MDDAYGFVAPPLNNDYPVETMGRPEWDMRMAIDVAIGSSRESIIETYDLVERHYDEIIADPVFCARVIQIRKELEKEGVSFKLKTQMMAEALLPHVWQIATSPESGAAVRASSIRDVVRWAGLSNEKVQTNASAGGGFSVNINFGTQQTAVIEGVPNG